MLNITFYVESDRLEEFAQGRAEYETIWAEHGAAIVEKLEALSTLTFQETLINAVVFRGRPHSTPLSLRDNLNHSIKKATIVHELCHRLIAGNKKAKILIGVAEHEQHIQNHKQVNLILFDALCDLFGEDLAQETVAWESESPNYKIAWDYALAMTREQRAEAFQESVTESVS